MSNLEQISEAWHKLVEAALGKGYISAGDKSWLLSPDRIKITPIESGMLELSINFPSIDGVEEAKNIPLKIAAALSIQGVESDKIFNKVDVERDLGINYSGEVKATLSNSEETLEILNGAKEKLEDVNLNLIEKAEEIKQTKNLEKISEAWHKLIETALGKGYASDRNWFLSPDRVKVTPMEGDMVELSVSYSYSTLGGSRQAEDVPSIMAGALEKEGVLPSRISLNAGNFVDYGVTCYHGHLKALLPNSQGTIDMLGKAVWGAKLINPMLVKQGQKIEALIAEAEKMVNQAGSMYGVTAEQLKYWRDSLPDKIRGLLDNSPQLSR